MITSQALFGLFIFGVIVYAVCTDKPQGRDTVKYVSAKIGAGIASISIGMLAVRISGTENFLYFAVALLIGQMIFKVFEERVDRLARIHC